MGKKLLLSIALFLVLCRCAIALPLGNPADPCLYTKSLLCEGWNPYLSVRLGYYGDFVFNRYLERASGVARGKDLEHCRFTTNSGLLVVNICKKVDVFSTLGATSVRIHTRSDSGPYLDHEFNSRFSWSIGARGVVWECMGATLGVEGQYFSFCPHTTRLTIGSVDSDYPSGARAHAHEWQVGLGVAYRFSFLVPYVGIKWSRVRFDNNDALVLGTTIPDFKSHKHIGYAVGVSLFDCALASLAVEGRFADEKAVSVNGQINF